MQKYLSRLEALRESLPLSLDDVTWFSKPRGDRYGDFYSQHGIRGQGVWRGLLAMGPSHESCVIGRERFHKEGAVHVSRGMVYTSRPLGP